MHQDVSDLHFYLCAVVTTISAIVSLGFSVAATLKRAGEARVNGLYVCSRSLALCIVSAVPYLNRSVDWLVAIAWGMIAVQFFDALIGARIKDALKTYGPAGTAVLNLVVLLLMRAG